MSPSRNVLITGAGGYIGGEVLRRICDDRRKFGTVIAADIRLPDLRLDGVVYAEADVRDGMIAELIATHAIDAVVHLASVVNPGVDRALAHAIDVDGTRNVLDASVAQGVRQIIVTSSGAAYGYYADNPAWLDEADALRGNPEFAYSDHKREVEELLAAYRHKHPALRQLILRPGTVLGAATDNQITNLFHKRFVPGVAGSDTPFVFIWDQDVVACILKGLHEDASGIYNLAGDGTMTLREIAKACGGTYLAIPPVLIQTALALLQRLRLTQYGPEQVNFLRYRPVLANRRLKEEFGYTPRKTTHEAFAYYLKHYRARGARDV